MGLIKAERASATSSAVPFSMRDVEAQARAIVLRAREQAEQILESARREAEVLRSDARHKGILEGREVGLQQGLKQGDDAGRAAAYDEHRARLAELGHALISAVEQLDASRKRLESEATTEVVRLAVAIARRVTKLAGSFDPNVLTANVSAALQLAVHAADVRIAINPAQKQTLIEALPELKLTWPNLQHVELLHDESVAPGGCRIHTRHGSIDSDLDEQLKRIAAELLPPGRAREGEAPAEPGVAPSPGTPGEGRGEGSSGTLATPGSAGASPSQQPSPPPGASA